MEYLDIYDKDRNLTGEKILRSKDMNIQGGYINIVIVFIQNSKGEFLIQKTSKEKGSIFATTGGFVKSGSTNNKTIVEEIKEELGIDIDINDLTLIHTVYHKHAIQDAYYVIKDIDINKLKLQKEEVEYVKWMSIEEIEALIEKGEFRKGNIDSFRYIKENKLN